MEVSRKTGHLHKELADDVAQLKESEKEIRAMVVCGTPAVSQVGKFVYDKSMPLNGIIAHLTRECRGKVCDKGIVFALGTGGAHRNVLDFYTSAIGSTCGVLFQRVTQ